MKIAQVGAIKNPLTIIAIFAGIAEISGTLVLPHIAPDNQYLYIWFLMGFPLLLVVIFFITLNFNHKVLYAPSDFHDENHFLSLIKQASVAEVLGKVARENVETPEVSEIIHSNANAQQEFIEPGKLPLSPVGEPAYSSPTPIPFPEKPYSHPSVDVLTKYFSSVIGLRGLERFAIRKTAKDIRADNIQFDVKIGDGSYVFDAISSTTSAMTVWEAFATDDANNAQQRVEIFLDQIAKVRDSFSPPANNVVSVVILPIFGKQMSASARSECTTRFLQQMHKHDVLGNVIGIDREALTQLSLNELGGTPADT